MSKINTRNVLSNASAQKLVQRIGLSRRGSDRNFGASVLALTALGLTLSACGATATSGGGTDNNNNNNNNNNNGGGTTTSVLALGAGVDTGLSSSDGITMASAVSVQVTMGTAGQTVVVTGTKTGDTTAMATGTGAVANDGTLTLPVTEVGGGALTDGQWTLSYTVAGIAGTNSLMLTLDRVAPADASTVTLKGDTDLAGLAQEVVSAGGFALMSVPAEVGGKVAWTLYRGANATDGVAVASSTQKGQEGTIDASGAAQLNFQGVTATDLTPGAYTLSYMITDVAGNVSQAYTRGLTVQEPGKAGGDVGVDGNVEHGINHRRDYDGDRHCGGCGRTGF